jgi:hypothetical protein
MEEDLNFVHVYSTSDGKGNMFDYVRAVTVETPQFRNGVSLAGQFSWKEDSDTETDTEVDVFARSVDTYIKELVSRELKSRSTKRLVSIHPITVDGERLYSLRICPFRTEHFPNGIMLANTFHTAKAARRHLIRVNDYLSTMIKVSEKSYEQKKTI